MIVPLFKKLNAQKNIVHKKYKVTNDQLYYVSLSTPYIMVPEECYRLHIHRVDFRLIK